jgi:hypothetical protein
MFKKIPFECPLPCRGVHYRITKVVQKTDGDSIDSVTVSDFSENFSEFPRKLESENFSIPAQQASGLSMKEVNSVLFHESELSEKELAQINAELERKEDPVEPTNE